MLRGFDTVLAQMGFMTTPESRNSKETAGFTWTPSMSSSTTAFAFQSPFEAAFNVKSQLAKPQLEEQQPLLCSQRSQSLGNEASPSQGTASCCVPKHATVLDTAVTPCAIGMVYSAVPVAQVPSSVLSSHTMLFRAEVSAPVSPFSGAPAASSRPTAAKLASLQPLGMPQLLSASLSSPELKVRRASCSSSARTRALCSQAAAT